MHISEIPGSAPEDYEYMLLDDVAERVTVYSPTERIFSALAKCPILR